MPRNVEGNDKNEYEEEKVYEIHKKNPFTFFGGSESIFKILIVGKVGVGKSSLINSITG